MRIVIAPDSFKESLTAVVAARAIERGIKRVLPHAKTMLMPMADGGEGTLDALIRSAQGRRIYRIVAGPLGAPVRAAFGIIDDHQTAVVEMAAASGLPSMPNAQRNPMRTTSYGTGELIRAALTKKPSQLIVCVGGSATNEGGAGMLQALGARMFDRRGRQISTPITGAALGRITRIDLDGVKINHACEIIIASDVRNPLVGKYGATAVFGPQKGATLAMRKTLEQSLKGYGRILERISGRKLLRLPGAGAGGGIVASLIVLGGQLRSGAMWVAESIGLPAAIRDADLVITGEGCIDAQTLSGKVVDSVGELARKFKVPVIAIGGSLGPAASTLFERGFVGIESSVVTPMSLQRALDNASQLLTDAAVRVAMRLKSKRGYRRR